MAISTKGSGGKTTGKLGAVRSGKTTQSQPVVGRKTTRKAAVVKGPTSKNPAITGKTTRRAPVAGTTARKQPVGATTGGRTAISRSGKKKFNFSPIIGLVLGIGLLYGAWYVYDMKKKEDAAQQAAIREQEEKERLAREAEEKRIADEKLRAQQAIEAARKAEEDRVEAARIAKLKMEEAERLAREAEAARLAEEKRKQEAELARNTKSALDEAAAKAKEAMEYIAEGEYEKAEGVLRPALGSQYLPKEDKEKFTALADNAALFAMTMATVRPGVRSSAKDMYTLTRNDGTTITGKVVSEALGRINILNANGAGVTFQSDQIVKRVKFTQDQLDKRNMQELKSLREKAQSGSDWYLLGVRAIELGKKDIAQKCFSSGMEKDPKLATNVREYKAMRLFASGAFDKSLGADKSAQRKFDRLLKEYPGTKAAIMAGGAIKDEEAAIAQIATSKEASGSTGESSGDVKKMHSEIAAAKSELTEEDKNVRAANGFYSKGESLERKAQSGELSRAETNKCYKEAVVQLRKAIAAYQEIMKKKPSPEIEKKLIKATRKFYWCKKLQTLG